ncbi:hypothetical protein A4G99_09090 [Haladaptatus sp. R4]|uniref:DUF7344 domain-containing protein n=1 Tax=Haladaptatus sp. R4 TaxID=1679489 RepID=UPI0007B4CEEA|nr:hypothetical protein [Haladaptatus sp. R4]KZN24524.1 hypothetical protein A4G99_09090 [Haladaptatus sp. R4]
MTQKEMPTVDEDVTPVSSPTDLSNAFDALRRPERRAVLQYFGTPNVDRNGAADVDELVEFVSERLGELDERAVESSLYHHHLPKLADVGLIDYDRTRSVVSRPEDVGKLCELILK